MFNVSSLKLTTLWEDFQYSFLYFLSFIYILYITFVKKSKLKILTSGTGTRTRTLTSGFGDRYATNYTMPIYLVGGEGLEPSTSTLSEWRSDQLSYPPCYFFFFIFYKYIIS